MPVEDQKVEIICDASQLNTTEACPRKWFYSYKRSLVPNLANKSFDIGSYYHEVLDHYYSLPQDMRPVQRVADALTMATHPELLSAFNITDEVKLFHLSRLKAYFFRYIEEDELITPIAIEKGFSYILYEDDERRYILEGKVDLVGMHRNYGLFVMDHKTQSVRSDIFPCNHQVLNYFNYVRPQYFIYNYIGLAQKINDNTFERTLTKPSEGMLEQWKRDVKRTFDEMFHYIRSENEQDYPRRRASCVTRYGVCHYQKLCTVEDDHKLKGCVYGAFKRREKPWRAWA